jgi:4-amino-4-deoxy-L-arabinose transferase and related glycosyltransferases of PMT family
MKKITENNAASTTRILIFVTFLVRLLIAAYTGLGIGESYYFRGAVQLNLSYFDQPPLFFWLSGLSIKLFGLNTFGLRFPAVVLFAGTCWFLFLVTRRLFNARSGFWAVVAINLSAVFTVPVACWFQPDAPLMFFWLVSAYLVIQIMFPAKDSDVVSPDKIYLLWILTGITMGLATLSKYHVLFLFAGIFLFAVTNKKQRHWLRHPGPYIAIFITFIIALPILWWNYKNNWASFIFQGSRAAATHEKFTWHFDWFLRSIGGQAVWLLPWIWIPLVVQLIKSYRLRKTSPSYSFCFWTAVLPIGFFTIVTLWSDLQYHFHWQAPGYMMLFIPLGYAIDQNLHSVTRWRGITKRWLVISASFIILIVGVVGTHMVTGFWQSYGPKWVVGLGGGTIDPTIEGVDYDDLRIRFEKEGWMQNKKIFAGSTRWWLTGKVDWALRGKKEIICFSDDPRNTAFFVDPNTLIGFDAIVISREQQYSIDADVKPYFDEVIPLPDVEITRGGIIEMRLQAHYCRNFHLPATPREDMPLYRQLTGRLPF